ncbi:MAG: DNA-directed RNA polymerase subunit omega [archaeon]|jgi:DNA-directed RNA polymerase subunit K/omega
MVGKLTKYEITRLVSARAQQLSCGAPPLVKFGKESSAYSIAKEEFDNKTIPLAVIRNINNVKVVVTVN